MRRIKYLLIPVFLVLGVLIGYWVCNNLTKIPFVRSNKEISQKLGVHGMEMIGFLPYWLVNDTKNDYSKYLTNLTYFGLGVSGDGSIVKASEPGFAKLDKSDLNTKLVSARKKGMTTSLLLYAADDMAIDELIKNPEESAKKLVDEVIPIMKQYGYTDLDVDLETLRVATKDEQTAFTKFLKIVSQNIKNAGYTVTICLPVSAFSYDTIISPTQIQPLVDRVVIMTYDFFYRGSLYSGPNAPLDEIDKVINSALKTFKSEQIILGMPLYSYTWETLKNEDGATIVPSSGETLTQKKLAELLSGDKDYKTEINKTTGETFLYYKDSETSSYHVTYYPSDESVKEKIELVKKYNLGGMAFWALGYENDSYLDQFKELKKYYWQEKLQFF